MTGLLAALVLSALEVRAHPESLTLGKSSSARVEIVAPPSARVGVSTTVGRVSAARPLGGGRFEARYTPPPEHLPQVAILLVTVDDGKARAHAWLALPLVARAELKIDTKPNATVRVTVGPRRFGPVTADRQGHVELPALVPPGVATAQVEATDRAGNTTVRPLDLKPRPFPLVRFAEPERTASWADAAPTPLELFAIQPDGTPRTVARGLTVSAAAGTLGAPVPGAPGVFTVPYRAPGVGALDTVRAAAEGSVLAAEERVRLKPGPPARLGLGFRPEAYVAGTAQPVRVEIHAEDARGNPLEPRRAEVASDFGTVVAERGGPALRVPDHFGGRTRVKVQAVQSALRGEAFLPLRAGPARTALLLSMPRFLRPYEAAAGVALVSDGLGNPVEGAPLTVTSSGGERAQVTELGKGTYRVRYTPTAREGNSELRFELAAGGAPLAHAGPIAVLPAERAWNPSVGLFLAGQTNFVHAHALIPRLELGLRVARTQLTLLAQVERDAYASFHQRADSAQPALDVSLSGWAVALGVRYHYALSQRAELTGAVLVGVLSTSSTLTPSAASGLPAVSQSAGTGLLRLALGPAFRLGPGQLLTQLEYTLARAPATTQLRGSLGGLGLSVGYRFVF